MSYVSGFMMGAAIGKAVRGAITGQSRHHAQKKPFALVSVTPGRRRYRIPALKKELAELLEKKLVKLSYITKVEANPLTGSLLICHKIEAEAEMKRLSHFLAKNIFGITPSHAHCGGQGRVPLRAVRLGDITASVRRSACAFNNWVCQKTCGWLDLSSIVSMLFFWRGIRRVLCSAERPNGPQMLWWGLSLLRGHSA